MKLVSVEIRGRRSCWGVNWYASQDEIEAMRSDGVEVYEIENIIPGWVAAIGMTRAFVFMQDLWNFRNPFN